MGTAMVGTDAFRHLSSGGVSFLRSANEFAQQRKNKQLGNEVSRHRMARQTHQRLAAGLAQDGGLAGFDGDAVEQE